MEDYSRAYGLRFAALRYFNAAGASPRGDLGELHDPETHLIPLVLEVALGKRRAVQIFGDDYPTPDGTCIRDYVHVDDLASALDAGLPITQLGGDAKAGDRVLHDILRQRGVVLSPTEDAVLLAGWRAGRAGAALRSRAVGRRNRLVWPARVVARWLLPGAFVGLSYVALFEAFYRGTVSVVAPIVATESLFGVVFSALLLHRSERVGARVVLGATLVVSGSALIAVVR